LYGLALDKDFKILAEVDLRIKPIDGVYKVQAEALHINKINLVEHNKDKLTLNEKRAAIVFKEFLISNMFTSEELKSEEYKKLFNKRRLRIAGHNVDLDKQFIKAKFIDKEVWNEYFENKTLDTAVIAIFLQECGMLPPDLNCSLGSLANYLGIDSSNAHNAKADVIMTYNVLLKLMEIVKKVELK
jgi:hypothetical protein